MFALGGVAGYGLSTLSWLPMLDTALNREAWLIEHLGEFIERLRRRQP